MRIKFIVVPLALLSYQCESLSIAEHSSSKVRDLQLKIDRPQEISTGTVSSVPNVDIFFEVTTTVATLPTTTETNAEQVDGEYPFALKNRSFSRRISSPPTPHEHDKMSPLGTSIGGRERLLIADRIDTKCAEVINDTRFIKIKLNPSILTYFQIDIKSTSHNHDN
jgi:hypothetical protein